MTVAGIAPQAIVLLHNDTTEVWEPDPEESAQVLALWTTEDGRPASTPEWFACGTSTALPAIPPGESIDLPVTSPRSARTADPGRYGVLAELRSLGVRTPQGTLVVTPQG